MYPFRHILFPTNFSAHSRFALQYASAFARANDGSVLLVNVQPEKVQRNLLTLSDGELTERESKITAELNDLLSDPLLSRTDVRPVIVDGDPAEEIARAAMDHEVDLITVVTHNRRGLSRALGSSIAEEIVAAAPCPVLTLRPPQHEFVEHRDGEPKLQINRVLLTTNFRPSSAAAAQLATQLVSATGAELHTVYVVGDYFEQISAVFPEGGLAALTRLREYIEERMTQFESNEPRAITHIKEGRAYQEIVKLATDLDCDLLVLGTAVHTSLFGNSNVLGSEIERVIRHSPCPVLCVPAAKVLTPLPALVTQAVPQT